MKLNCLIVEDEKIAREGIADYIRRIPFLNLSKSFDNAHSALQYIQNNSPDLIFLDIEMKGINGMKFAQMLPVNGPMIIFTTAYAGYALEGYRTNAVGYLLKPIFFEDFEKAVLKVQKILEDRTPSVHKYLYIKENGRDIKINLEDILYIKSMENYIVLQLRGKSHITLLSMKKVKELLPAHFIPTHRSYLVNMHHATQVDDHFLYLGEYKVPVSTRMKQEVKKHFING